MPDEYFKWTEMKIHLVAVFSLICTIYADAQTYTNPVIHSDYSDPDVCRTGNDFYMTSSSFNCFPGLQILHSTDLVNWQIVGAALPRQQPNRDNGPPAGNPPTNKEREVQ